MNLNLVNAQDGASTSHQGVFNAYLHTQAGLFVRDSTIGASGTPQYDHQLFGSESWLAMQYSNWGFDFGLRADLFQNSNLINPQASFNKQGIGRWFIKRDIEKIGFELGYIYDQIGSGIIYRAYEQRNLGLDNALFGLKLNYHINEDWNIKAFSGKQKKQFDLYESLIKGINLEGYVQPHDSSKWSMVPSLGFVNRTLDDASMNNVLATLSTYQSADQFLPKYNSYSFTLYDQINLGNLSIYLESAFKPKDIINDPNGIRKSSNGENIIGPVFKNKMGQVIYGALNFAKSGWGISLEGKRVKYFSMRTRPQEELNNGLIHFVPAMSRQNSYRLLSFYQPATQEIGELAFQGELQVSPLQDWTIVFHQSLINDLNAIKLYRESLFESSIVKYNKFTLISGIQLREYNQAVYEGKPNAPIVSSITPYFDYIKQLNRKNSIRINGEFMISRQAEGSWMNFLLEYSIAPKWIFTLSDMYNVKPVKGNKYNYYTAGATYIHDANRFSVNWVRQRAGIVCTGGICRYEPAFNGIKINLESRF